MGRQELPGPPFGLDAEGSARIGKLVGISNTVWAVFLRIIRSARLAHRSSGHAAFRGLAPEGPPEVDSILKPPPNSIRDSSQVGKRERGVEQNGRQQHFAQITIKRGSWRLCEDGGCERRHL